MDSEEKNKAMEEILTRQKNIESTLLSLLSLTSELSKKIDKQSAKSNTSSGSKSTSPQPPKNITDFLKKQNRDYIDDLRAEVEQLADESFKSKNAEISTERAQGRNKMCTEIASVLNNVGDNEGLGQIRQRIVDECHKLYSVDISKSGTRRRSSTASTAKKASTEKKATGMRPSAKSGEKVINVKGGNSGQKRRSSKSRETKKAEKAED